MAPFLVSPNVTAFIGTRRHKEFFEGRVTILEGAAATRTEHVCLGLRDTEDEALNDARRDAVALVRMWRQRVELSRRRP